MDANQDGQRRKRLKRNYEHPSLHHSALPTTPKSNARQRSSNISSSGRRSESRTHAPPTKSSQSHDLPSDPAGQRLWIAKAIKEAVRSKQSRSRKDEPLPERDVDGSRDGRVTRLTNGANKSPQTMAEHNSAGIRSSGRKRRQTSKAKDSVLAEMESQENHKAPMLSVASQSDAMTESKNERQNTADLTTNRNIRNALFFSSELSPDELVDRHEYGDLLLNCLAAESTHAAASQANKLMLKLRQQSSDAPLREVMQILAGFPEVLRVVERIIRDANGQNCVPDRGKPTSMPVPEIVSETILPLDVPIETVKKTSSNTSSKTSNKVGIGRTNQPQPPSEVIDLDGVASISKPAETQTQKLALLNRKQAKKTVAALNGAAAVLDDMAYGGLRYYFMPHGNSANNKYTTPYGPPPKEKHSSRQRDRQRRGSTPDVPTGILYETPSQTHQPSSGLDPDAYVRKSLGSVERQPKIAVRQADLPAAVQENGLHHLMPESTTREKTENAAEQHHVQETVPEEEDRYALTQDQIDGFLALASGGKLVPADDDSDDDSDSDDEIDKTTSRPGLREPNQLGDPLVESVIQGILTELATGQNWGHGLGWLTPQAHLHQINNSQQFSDGLRSNIDQARLQVNCIVPTEQSLAQEALYKALIKRIANPYSEGKAPMFSNIIYYNGKAYHAVPGPAHPMFAHQQLTQPTGPSHPLMLSPPPHLIPMPPETLPPATLPSPVVPSTTTPSTTLSTTAMPSKKVSSTKPRSKKPPPTNPPSDITPSAKPPSNNTPSSKPPSQKPPTKGRSSNNLDSKNPPPTAVSINTPPTTLLPPMPLPLQHIATTPSPLQMQSALPPPPPHFPPPWAGRAGPPLMQHGLPLPPRNPLSPGTSVPSGMPLSSGTPLPPGTPLPAGALLSPGMSALRTMPFPAASPLPSVSRPFLPPPPPIVHPLSPMPPIAFAQANQSSPPMYPVRHGQSLPSRWPIPPSPEAMHYSQNYQHLWVSPPTANFQGPISGHFARPEHSGLHPQQLQPSLFLQNAVLDSEGGKAREKNRRIAPQQPAHKTNQSVATPGQKKRRPTKKVAPSSQQKNDILMNHLVS